eukprot:3795240-Amphidinium_carterae.1
MAEVPAAEPQCASDGLAPVSRVSPIYGYAKTQGVKQQTSLMALSAEKESSGSVSHLERLVCSAAGVFSTKLVRTSQYWCLM